MNPNKSKPTTIGVDQDGYWTCLCGNHTLLEDFRQCGEEDEPAPEEWTADWYVCNTCGRIIDQVTARVIGIALEHNLTMEECNTIIDEVRQFGLPE